MLFTATTVKDNLAGVERYVDGNLANGADHLIVFLDAPQAEGQAEVAVYLAAHPQVTAVSAGEQWWGEHRPRELNERQCTNANVAKQLVAQLAGDAWVAHIDGDEVLLADAGVMSAIPSSAQAVHFDVLETVSRMRWESSPTWFKHQLGEDDLTLLHTLGAIAEPTNRAYFHGHLQGKSAVRADSDAYLSLHKPIDASGFAAAAYAEPQLRHLHFESYSGEDFVRKWTAMVASGPTASFRPGRAKTAAALRRLVEKNLPQDRLEHYLLQIFERTTLDDADTLQSLGLIEEIDPLTGTHRPNALDDTAKTTLAEAFSDWVGRPKQEFFYGASAKPRKAVEPEDAGERKGFLRRRAT